MQKMESDPLLENLDDLLPVTDSSVPTVPANLPSVVEDICTALMEEEEIEAVDIGRQVSSLLQHATWLRLMSCFHTKDAHSHRCLKGVL